MATRDGRAKDAADGRETWDLPENAAARLPGGRSAVVHVERGTVLVTQEDDPEDHVLEAGEELVLRHRGLAVAWAFTEATLSVAGAEWTRPPGPRDGAAAPRAGRHAPGDAPSHAGT